MMSPLPRRQAGSTLLVALVMLGLTALLAVLVFNLGKNSLQIVGNMQQRNETLASASSTIEAAISTTRMFNSPSDVFVTPCNKTKNTLCFDTNGDGITDVTVTLATPLCIQAKTIKNNSLVLTDPNDAGCSVGVSQSYGIEGAATGDSLCASTLWDLQAQALDAVTQASSTVAEGVAVRISTDNVVNFCP